jgi:hypothetical protein
MAATKRDTRKTDKNGALPDRIFAQASVRSIGGVSLFDADGQINAATVVNFHSDINLVNRAALLLRDAGFEILQISELTINIAGSPATFETAFGAPVVAEERPVLKPGQVEDTATFIECHNSERPGLISVAQSRFTEVLEGVAIEDPRYWMAALPFPPVVDYWHLEVPADVSLGCNADRAHRAGTTGLGIKVAMCDSGHFAHPFFAARGYRVAPVTLGPGAANPLVDENGHGTAESANIFAVAPDVQLLPVKMSFVNSNGAFNAAVGLGPDIITCSWGSSKPPGSSLSAADLVLSASIANAVASGIVVVFSAGNGHWGFPGMHPDVISAGGTFMDADGSLRASDYSSGFDAGYLFPGRRVPDLCGLVGMRPRAAYILLPLQEGCEIDQDLAGGSHPSGDETANDDGWAAISGTSAAAPQLAGAAALVKQACQRLTPAEVRDILMRTARDVTAGTCHPNQNNPAGPGPDLATGQGLVDAHRAVLVAKLRCSPITPIQPPIGPVPPPITPVPIRPPITPVQPIRPPITPVQPIRPPITPVQPIRPPITPVQPIRPINPIGPVVQQGATPSDQPTAELTAQPAQAEPPRQPLTSEEVKDLEEMVMRGEIDSDDVG